MCWKEKIQLQRYPRASERACVTFPLFGQGKIIYFFLMVICNSLLLLKSLPINVINCIKFYVNCSALTTPMIGNKNNCCLFICKSSPMIHCGNRSFLEVT